MANTSRRSKRRAGETVEIERISTSSNARQRGIPCSVFLLRSGLCQTSQAVTTEENLHVYEANIPLSASNQGLASMRCPRLSIQVCVRLTVEDSCDRVPQGEQRLLCAPYRKNSGVDANDNLQIQLWESAPAKTRHCSPEVSNTFSAQRRAIEQETNLFMNKQHGIYASPCIDLYELAKTFMFEARNLPFQKCLDVVNEILVNLGVEPERIGLFVEKSNFFDTFSTLNTLAHEHISSIFQAGLQQLHQRCQVSPEMP